MGDKPPLFWEDIVFNRTCLGLLGFFPAVLMVSVVFAAPVYVENPGFEEPDINC